MKFFALLVFYFFQIVISRYLLSETKKAQKTARKGLTATAIVVQFTLQKTYRKSEPNQGREVVDLVLAVNRQSA